MITLRSLALAVGVLPAISDAAASVDACALLSMDQATTLLERDGLETQSRSSPDGATSDCVYADASQSNAVTLHTAAAARFSDEVEGAKLSAQTVQQSLKVLADFPGTAYADPMGILYQPRGAPYFIRVTVMRDGQVDAQRSLEAARKLTAEAKPVAAGPKTAPSKAVSPYPPGESPLAYIDAIAAETEIPEMRDAAAMCEERWHRVDQQFNAPHLAAILKSRRRGSRDPLDGETGAQAGARWERERTEDGAAFDHPAARALRDDPRFNCTGEGSSGAAALRTLEAAVDRFAKPFVPVREAARKEAKPCQDRVNKSNSSAEAAACNKALQERYAGRAHALAKQGAPALRRAYAEYYRNRRECLAYREAALDRLPPEVRGKTVELHARAQDWEIAYDLDKTLSAICRAGTQWIDESIPMVQVNGV